MGQDKYTSRHRTCSKPLVSKDVATCNDTISTDEWSANTALLTYVCWVSSDKGSNSAYLFLPQDYLILSMNLSKNLLRDSTYQILKWVINLMLELHFHDLVISASVVFDNNMPVMWHLNIRQMLKGHVLTSHDTIHTRLWITRGNKF